MELLAVEETVVRYLFKQDILGKARPGGRVLVMSLGLEAPWPPSPMDCLQMLPGCATRVPKHLALGTTISLTIKAYCNSTVGGLSLSCQSAPK